MSAGHVFCFRTCGVETKNARTRNFQHAPGRERRRVLITERERRLICDGRALVGGGVGAAPEEILAEY